LPGSTATILLANAGKLDRQIVVKVLNPELAAANGDKAFLSAIRVTANPPRAMMLS